MSGEFTDRENELSGLPEDIQAERDNVDFLQYQAKDNASPLGDIIYQNIEAEKPTQLGTIPYSGEVISTYDSRPINAFDFAFTDFVQWNITGNPPTALILTSSHTIPGGYIGVLKGYRFEMEPLVPITVDDLLLDIFINDKAQQGYQSLKHGQMLKNFVPAFILIDDGGTIKFQFRAPTGIASLMANTRHMHVELYGNLILTTGAPLNLEIANKEVGLPVKTEQAERMSPMMRSIRRSQLSSQGLFRRFRFFR